MSNKKKILAVVIVAIIGTIIFWKKDWLKGKLGLSSKAEIAEKSDNTILPPPPSTPGIDYKTCNFPIKIGCKGKRVKDIQIALNKKHNSGIQADGYFGTQTENALKNAGYGKEIDVWKYIKLKR